MSSVTKERLLTEIEDIIRQQPPNERIRQDAAWFGRALAAIENWDRSKIVSAFLFHSQFLSNTGLRGGDHLHQFVALLHQARHDLLMQVPSAGSVAVSGGMVFEYFDQLRKVIEMAKQDILFVDPYLDAEFVSRYLPHAAAEVTIRLLTREKLSALLPAVDAFCRQTGNAIQVRSAAKFHDRYLLVDRISCYQSGASFKDGAKSAPTTLTQIIDAFEGVARTYEELWDGAKVER
jgi:hypothetical protein